MLIQRLILLQINDLAEVKNRLDHIEIELAEDRMVVVEAKMTHIHLHLLLRDGAISLAELFLDLKEAFFNLPLNPRLQLFLHVVELEVLALEVL